MGILSVTNYGNPLLALTASWSADAEGTYPPAAWETDYGRSGGADITQSSDVVIQGSYVHKIVNTPDNHAMYRGEGDLSISTSAWTMCGYCRVASLTNNNTYANFFWTGKTTSPYGYVWPSVKKVSGEYYWAMHHFNASNADTVKVSSTVVELNKTYYVECGVDGSGYVWLKVDGIMICVDSGGITLSTIKYGVINSPVSTGNGTATTYTDNVRIHSKVLRFSKGLIAADGSWVNCACLKTSHASGDGEVKCFRSTDDGVTWNLQQSITAEVGKDVQPYSIARVGSNIYLSVVQSTYSDGHIYHSTIWKSTDHGVSWSNVCTIAEGCLFFPADNIEYGTELAVLIWWTGSSIGLSHVHFGLYDTADNTYSIGTEIAAHDDYTNAFPNEGTFYQKDNGDIVAFVRWDDYSGSDQLFIVAYVSDDDGATWGSETSLSATWGKVGGTPCVCRFMDRYWISCYRREPTAGTAHKSIIFEFDPDDYSRIGDEESPTFTETSSTLWGEEGGNGNMWRLPSTNTVTLCSDNGTSSMYLLDLSGLVPVATISDVTPARRQNTITWSSDTVDSYNIYWSKTSPVTKDDNLIEDVTSPYEHTGLDGGDTYYYKISCVFDGIEGELSNEESGTAESIPDMGAISVIAGIDKNTISWDDEPTANSYNLYWDTSSPVSLSSNKITGVTSPYEHTREPWTEVFYAATYIETGTLEESGLSGEESGTPGELPAEPDITANRYGSVILTWDSVPHADTYLIIYYINGVEEDRWTPSAPETISVTGMDITQSHLFSVQAVNSFGNSTEVIYMPEFGSDGTISFGQRTQIGGDGEVYGG